MVPQNVAAAVTYGCIECVTTALATQLVVTLDGPLSEDGTAALAELWEEIAAFGQSIQDVPLSELQARLTEYEARILEIVQNDPAAVPAEQDDPGTQQSPTRERPLPVPPRPEDPSSRPTSGRRAPPAPRAAPRHPRPAAARPRRRRRHLPRSTSTAHHLRDLERDAVPTQRYGVAVSHALSPGAGRGPAGAPGRGTVAGPGSRSLSGVTSPSTAAPAATRSVALVTLGCARNEVDSSELGGRLPPPAGGSSTTPPTPTSRWSTRAASWSRPRRTRSTRCWRPRTCGPPGAPGPSWRSAASPSGTAGTSRPRCLRRTRCSGSTATQTCPGTSTPSWPGGLPHRTRPGTGDRCCR